MKKSIIFCAVIIAAIMLSCKQEHATQFNKDEKVLIISHGRYHGECIGYCERILEVKSDSTKIIMKGWDTKSIPIADTVYNNFSTSKVIWDSLKASFSLNKFMQLDSVDYPLGSVDQGHTWIHVKTNLRERIFAFDESDSIETIIKLNSMLWDLRASYGIDMIVFD